jgi:hypothetical protein
MPARPIHEAGLKVVHHVMVVGIGAVKHKQGPTILLDFEVHWNILHLTDHPSNVTQFVRLTVGSTCGRCQCPSCARSPVCHLLPKDVCKQGAARWG